ncbi:hypothetical protein PTSG_01127 [Salpingoeca rosetta]|uniref:Importin N-terminal domain-containing protein n=1 Tax=Salpingoeca rosetta (strain ATCC 50818 / BSB-021) TaxID=946362 RepID=F2U0W2_SALR5|nr:uncharacterized protein PTSG_01127 [Salpingoeca rosetta]EGD80536.1 hypothetical protein PTSG_01127 [Salpingoeca rosetta]|eukprot:XP_004997097.1 hypothetical protein PTSG_01127 [Salpingoeca rosetta]
MDPEVLQNVANAVMVMQDPSAPAETKHEAFEYFNAFKDQAQDAPAYGLYMASIQEQSMIADHNDLIRHFGLQLLEHCVQHRWDSYAQEQKEEMKQALLHNLIMRGTFPLLQERPFIMEKIASLVSEVAIREWPQRWPDFLDILLEIAANSSTQTYIVLTCLKTFTETIFQFSDALTNQRRNDLVRSHLRLMLVVALVASFNNLPTAEEHQEQLQTLFGAILQEWLNLEHIVSSPEQLVEYGGLNQPMVDNQNNRTMMMTILGSLATALSNTKPRPAPYAKATPNGNGGCDSGGIGSAFPSQALCELALPLVLSLVRTLHTLETQACTALSGELRVLLGLRRSDMLLHLPNVVDESARQMDPHLLWVDRSQLWLASLRTNVYTILQSCAKHGILYYEGVLPMFADTVMTGLDEMSSHNWKAFFRHVVAPFEQYIPRSPPALDAATAVLGQLYASAAAFLERALPPIEAADQAAANGNAREAPQATMASSFLTAEQREIVDDALRSTAADAVLVHFHQMLSDHCQPAADKGKDEIFVSPLATYFLFSDATALAIIRITQVALTRGSGSLAKRAASCVSRIVRTTAGNDVYRGVVQQQLLPATLKAMFHHGQHQEYLTDFVNLLMRCIDVLQPEDIPDAFGSIPNLDVEAIQRYYSEVQSGHLKSVKSKRNQLKKLFQSCIGLHVSQWASDRVKVLNLPEKLFLSSKQRRSTQDSDDVTVLPDFFDA